MSRFCLLWGHGGNALIEQKISGSPPKADMPTPALAALRLAAASSFKRSDLEAGIMRYETFGARVGQRSHHAATHCCSSVMSSHSMSWKQRLKFGSTQLSMYLSPAGIERQLSRTRW